MRLQIDNSIVLGILFVLFTCRVGLAADRPNVILIMCDDLNDYIEGLGGHPQARTPNIARLAESGVTFAQAHCNIPICGPSRASMFTGVYPHHSGCYGFVRWDGYDVLTSSRTMQDHFRENGYWTLGTGKLMHHMVRKEWKNYGNRADYGPWVYDGENKLAHPDVPAPYREIGSVDGSFGPLENLVGRTSSDGKPLQWWTGSWANQRPLKFYESTKLSNSTTPAKRDPTADELNGQWAVDQINLLADRPGRSPFFLGVGFIRPHTPLVVPQKYFDMYPLDSIELPVIRPGDVEDTFAHTIRAIPEGADGPRSEDMGTRLFKTLVESYDSQDEALRRFMQAYLASVTSVDDQIGRILDAVEDSPFRDNTIIVLTSDHGWGMGEKNYLYKNSLWQESTRVPLIIRAPEMAESGGRSDQPVSLIDIYPTLIDLCGLTNDTVKDDAGHPLDGHSLKPLLKDPERGEWDGPESALTALYKWRMKYDPSQESYSLRAKDWRYIRYENGKEELYFAKEDPYEWKNLAMDPQHAKTLALYRQELKSRIPAAGTKIPPQPPFQPKETAIKRPAVKR
ncbi:MAG: sulfatase [Planctomycetota bacterium]